MSTLPSRHSPPPASAGANRKVALCSLIEHVGLHPDPHIALLGADDEWLSSLVDARRAIDEALTEAGHRLSVETSRAIGTTGWAVAAATDLRPESPAFTACLVDAGGALAVVVLPGQVIWDDKPEGAIPETLRDLFDCSHRGRSALPTNMAGDVEQQPEPRR